MAKTLVVVVVVLAAGAYWIWGGSNGGEAQAGGRAVALDPAELAGRAAAEEPVRQPPRGGDRAPRGRDRRRDGAGGGASTVTPPAGAPQGAAATPAPAEAELEVPLKTAAPAPEPAAAAAPTAAERAARVEAVLARASQLQSAGDPQGAAAALREGMAESTSPAEVARLGLFLAQLTESPAEARRLITNALRRGVVHGEEYEVVRERLRALNRSVGSSLLGLLRVEHYEVQPNDSLWALCNRTFPERYGVQPEVGLVQLVNGMSNTSLRVGQTLAVPRETLSLAVDRENRGIVAYLGDVALVAYRVGLGKEGRTPSGTFVVEVKLTEPAWYRDGRTIPFGDPENILGTRWMGFENSPGAMGYGIHGTAHPETIGSNESMGCVRMRNEEVEELFDLVPRGTTVTIP